jgi:alpha-tubulin suppressor-like RCC1 family protein
MRSVRRLLILATLATGVVAACSRDTTDPFAPLALALTVAPSVDTIFVSDSIVGADAKKLTVSATTLGRPIPTPTGLEWTTSDPTVVAVGSDGTVRALSVGTATVTARVNSSRATATIVVAYRVRTLSLTPTSLAGVAGDTLTVTASARDASGVLVPGTAYTFASPDTSIATVTATGTQTARVKLVKQGTARVTVKAGGQTVDLTGTVQPREFISSAVAGAPAGALVLSAGQDATCGILPLGRAYCFGRAALLGTAKDTSCVNNEGPPEACSLVPLRVAGEINFVSVSVGDSVACGTTADNRAYCWGSQTYGQLGNGVTTPAISKAPVLVISLPSRTAVSLSRVTAGGTHACGLTPTGAAFCWGKDDFFQLGNGDDLAIDSATPVAVTGSLVFSAISAGLTHTCGITTAGAAYCWGENTFGQLGSGADFSSDHPAVVSGKTVFASISSGGYHTCGLTAAGVAFCWGDNTYGQLGVTTDTIFEADAPVPVDGNLRFKSISAGLLNTCGITTGGAAYCWGDNSYGQLGTNSGFFSDVPVAVTGGHTDFVSVTTGARHACANAAAGVFCWGSNMLGALGNQVRTVRQPTPTRVVVP